MSDDIKGFYDKGYVYNERAPYFVDKDRLSEEQFHGFICMPFRMVVHILVV